MVIPYSPIVVNTGCKLVVLDTGTGQANFATSKGAAGQFHTNLAGAGIDRESDRYRDHLAFSRRPHQRLLVMPTARRVSRMRKSWFRRRTEILDGRRRDEPSARRPHERRVQELRAACSTRAAAGEAIRSGQGNGARHHVGCDPRPHAGPHLVRRSRRAGKLFVQADVTNVPSCSCAIRAGTLSSTRTPKGPKRPAARPTTCWRPTR